MADSMLSIFVGTTATSLMLWIELLFQKHRLCNLQLESSIIHKCGSEVVYVCPTGGGGERRPVARQNERVSERGEAGKGEGDRREGVKVGQLLISS